MNQMILLYEYPSLNFGGSEVFLFVFVDVSTDGKWCYLVFWVVGKSETRWSLLKRRLLEACPSCSSASGMSFFRSEPRPPGPPDVFLLTFCCHDRRGLLHGVLLDPMLLLCVITTCSSTCSNSDFRY